MDARMREAFLRELMIATSPVTTTTTTTTSATTTKSESKQLNSVVDLIDTSCLQNDRQKNSENNTACNEANKLTTDKDKEDSNTNNEDSPSVDSYYDAEKQQSFCRPKESAAKITVLSDFGSIGRTLSERSFLPKKALVLRKFSRLEYERLCNPNLSEEQLASNLSQRGSVYESLKHYDQVQRSCLKQIESVLEANNIEYKTVDRFGYTEDKIDWADVIITSGGDGTFLMAASKVSNRDKPVIGVNSDPTKSVGHLCLPSKFTNNFDKVLELLKEGKFQWQFRQRLRVTLVGDAAEEEPKQLNDIRSDLRGINHQFDRDELQDGRISTGASEIQQGTNFRTVDGKVVNKVRQLKERALNEVFVGETLSARVSYYELSVDSNKLVKMKSSGLTICTGTGSTSWYYNINKLTEQQMVSIISIINKVTNSTKVETTDADTISDITRQFNQTLTFAPTEPRMAYSIRDPVGYASTMGSHRGPAKRLEVKSRMQNACLVLDGCQFYPFNDGSYTLIEMYDEDALKTISLDSV